MKNNIPLIELIKSNLLNGELPDSFSLPKDDDPNTLKWADGAFDGVSIFHMGHPEITDEHMKIVADAFSKFDEPDMVISRMKDFFAEVSPLGGIDDIQRYIMNNTDSIDAEKAYQLAVKCLLSADVDTVKFGMIIIELFNEPEDRIKDIIRTLGLSDEFSIFAVFNMSKWTNGNNEIFELAKKVHGWGRIHAVERLSPDTQEIKDWLLAEGINNSVLSEYSALEVYEKADIEALLRTGNISDTQTDHIAKVLNSMFSEGPVSGISALPENDSAEMIGIFIDKAAGCTPSPDICSLLLTISEDERFKCYADRCTEILNSAVCKELIEHELENGRAIDLAEATGIPYKEKIYSHLKNDFDNGWYNCRYLIGDDNYRGQIIDIFRKELPLATMTSDPAPEGKFSNKYAYYSKLSYLLQFLKDHPLCGTDLAAAALNMPDVHCRVQAIRTISEWCKIRKCTLSELSEELYSTMEHLRSVEENEQVRKIIEECGI